jgi:hypothetical protein
LLRKSDEIAANYCGGNFFFAALFGWQSLFLYKKAKKNKGFFGIWSLLRIFAHYL